MSKQNPDAEEAYEIWATTGARSDAKTAELAQVPRRTIAYWRVTYHWQERWLSLGSEEAALVARSAVQTMRSGMSLVTERMLAIVGKQVPQRKADGTPLLDERGQPVMTWASKDADAIKAGQLLAQYALGSPNQQTGPQPLEASYALTPEADYGELPEPDAATSEDLPALRAKAAAMLEDTAMRVNTRIEPGRKKGERL